MQMLLLGLARNCEKTVPQFLEFIEDLGKEGVECQALVGENGSSDNTKALLQSASKLGVELVDTSIMASQSPRLRRMATGRELLLQTARTRQLNSEGFIGVADLDNVFENPPQPRSVIAALKKLSEDPNLFAVSATSYPYYYDVLSLRTDRHDYTTLNKEIQEAKKNLLTYYNFHKRRIYAGQHSITREIPFLCTSAFNGFCVYNAADFLNGTYMAEDAGLVCEHVTMNLSIYAQTGKKMWIDPDMRVAAPADHLPVGPVRFYTDRIKKLLK